MQYIIVQQYITVYLCISTLNLYQVSASSIRTYQGREMPRTLATQAAGRFKNRQIRQAQWIQCIDERRKVILRLLLKAERIRRHFPCPDVVLNTDRIVFQRHTWTFFFIGLLSFLSFSIWTNLFFSGGATSCCNFGDKTEGVSTRRLVFPYIVKVVALICSQTPQAPRCLGPQMHQTGQANGKNRNTSLACAAWSLGAETGKIWKGSLNLESGVITRLLMILMIKYQLSSISDHQYPLVNKFQWP